MKNINIPEGLEQRADKIRRVNDRLSTLPDHRRVVSFMVGKVMEEKKLKLLPDFAIMDEINALDRDLRSLGR